jgi:hypothetical protein
LIGKIKHIIVIESLDESDGNTYTGKALYDDVIERRIRLFEKDFTHKLHQIDSKDAFIDIIKYYQVNSEYLTGGLLLHFEIHGDEDLKGLVLSNGELIVWSEIIDLLRPINVTNCNTLFVTMGVCNGRHLYKGVDPYKKSPYSGYISASQTVSPEEIYVNFSKLFEDLLENGNIVESYLELDKLKTNFYYKDSKSTFEDSFNIIITKFNNDEDFKSNFLKETIEQTEKVTGTKMTEMETDFIFKKAMVDMYDAQKKAFEFEDCK